MDKQIYISASKELPEKMEGTDISVPVRIKVDDMSIHAVYNFETSMWSLIGTAVTNGGMLIQLSRNEIRDIEKALAESPVFWQRVDI